jgi:pyridoxamine 5'-phosphate oxidase
VPESPRSQFQYALLRVVPHIERGEFVNAGVVVFCRPLRFLKARIRLDPARLRALAPDADPEPIAAQLDLMARIAGGDESAGPIARLEPSERFHWLAAPSSTVIQPSPVHTGLCDDPYRILGRLYDTLVEPPAVAGMRRSYTRAGLAEEDAEATWLEQFARWFGEAGGLREPNAMVVATSAPNARIVLLKGFDERGFVFFTDTSSAKGAEIAADPRVALVFPWHELERSVRVLGSAERLGDDEADAYFASRPLGSQLSAAASRQSTVIPSRAALEEERARLASAHPTAVPRPERWGGYRVAPESVEFWQGRPDRLHDRLRYRRSGDDWVVERLSP